MIVCKFGGTSVASLTSAKRIKKIVQANLQYKFVVVSAIGKSENYDTKVTDCLYEIYYAHVNNQSYVHKINEVFERYQNLAKNLDVKIDFEKDKIELCNRIKSNNASKEYIISRGEYLSAKLYAKYLKLKFLDAKDFIIFNRSGKINYLQTRKNLNKLNMNLSYVVGGFYGAYKNGEIVTFSRGGSDITGAIIAKILKAEVYENYTDVSGVFDKNPKLFNNANNMPILNYKTAEFMADAGTEVVHKEALSELKNTRVVLMVKNTFNSESLGTIIIGGNICFSNLFICVNSVKVLCFDKINEEDICKIKNYTEIEKIIKLNKNYYITCKQIYIPIEKIEALNNHTQVYDCCKFTLFSNIKINKQNLKIINKIKKIAKKQSIFIDFLSKNNNFVIICKKEFKNKIISIINNYLQK